MWLNRFRRNLFKSPRTKFDEFDELGEKVSFAVTASDNETHDADAVSHESRGEDSFEFEEPRGEDSFEFVEPRGEDSFEFVEPRGEDSFEFVEPRGEDSFEFRVKPRADETFEAASFLDTLKARAVGFLWASI